MPFSSKTTVHVSSVAYNLAGDLADRPNFRKSAALSAVLSKGKASIADQIVGAYARGPGKELRSFFRWADRNYALGLPDASIGSTDAIDYERVARQIPATAGTSVRIVSLEVGSTDWRWWVEAWFRETAPELVETNWSSSISSRLVRIGGTVFAPIHRTDHTIRIDFEDGSTTSCTPVGYVANGPGLIARYVIELAPENGDRITGTTTVLATGERFPSTTGWTRSNRTESERVFDLVRRTIGPDGETAETSRVVETDSQTEYRRERYLGDDGEGMVSREEWLTQIVEHDVETRTREAGAGTTIVEDILVTRSSWRIDHRDARSHRQSAERVFVYAVGGGNADLDAAFHSAGGQHRFFPAIPVRVDNKFVTENDWHADIVENVRRTYARATNRRSKLDDLIETLKDNPDLDQIDHAFVTWGVALNTKRKEGADYLFRFFTRLFGEQQISERNYQIALEQLRIEQAWLSSYEEWRRAQSIPSHRRYGQPAPPHPNSFSGRSLPGNTLTLGSTSPFVPFRPKLEWGFIARFTGSGRGRTGARPGDAWVTHDGSGHNRIRIWSQTGANSYTYLTVDGLRYWNPVYRGEAVTILGWEALVDPDESGFIVPLHYETYRSMPMGAATQLALESGYIVFNCFEVHKKRWYEHWLFQFVLAFAVSFAATYFVGAGLLGANALVGAAMGYAGTTAVIAGAAANAMAAVVLSQIISQGAVALFGDQLGAIVAAVASFVVMSGGLDFDIGNLASSWKDMMSADQILRLTSAVGDVYSGYVRADIAGMQADLAAHGEAIAQQTRSLADLSFQQFGDRGVIDPLSLFVEPSPSGETRDTFLQRTLLTGSEVADMSMRMIGEFTTLTLALPDSVR